MMNVQIIEVSLLGYDQLVVLQWSSLTQNDNFLWPL